MYGHLNRPDSQTPRPPEPEWRLPPAHRPLQSQSAPPHPPGASYNPAAFRSISNPSGTGQDTTAWGVRYNQQQQQLLQTPPPVPVYFGMPETRDLETNLLRSLDLQTPMNNLTPMPNPGRSRSRQLINLSPPLRSSYQLTRRLHGQQHLRHHIHLSPPLILCRCLRPRFLKMEINIRNKADPPRNLRSSLKAQGRPR